MWLLLFDRENYDVDDYHDYLDDQNQRSNLKVVFKLLRKWLLLFDRENYDVDDHHDDLDKEKKQLKGYFQIAQNVIAFIWQGECQPWSVFRKPQHTGLMILFFVFVYLCWCICICICVERV